MTRRRAPVLTVAALALGSLIAVPMAAVAQDAQQDVEREAQRAQQAAEQAQEAAQRAQEAAREARQLAQQAQREAQQEAAQAERQAQQEARQAREEAQRAEQEAQRDARREAERARAEEERDFEVARAEPERDVDRAAVRPGAPEEIEIVAPRTVRDRLPFGRGEQVSMTARVRYEDLDLSQTRDVRQLEERVNEAAQEVCEQLASMYPMGDPEPDACARQASAEAMSQVRSAIDAAGQP